MKSRLTGKDPDAGKDWGQEKGVTEDEMAGWHHRLNRHEFEQTLGDSEGHCRPMLQSMGSQRVGHDWATEQHQLRKAGLAVSLSPCHTGGRQTTGSLTVRATSNKRQGHLTEKSVSERLFLSGKLWFWDYSKWKLWGIPWWSSGQDFALSLPRPWVPSLFWEPESHRLCSVAKQNKRNKRKTQWFECLCCILPQAGKKVSYDSVSLTDYQNFLGR